MFNGIINNVGIVDKISFRKNDCIILVKSKIKYTKSEIGSSISCSGACLTLINIFKDKCEFYISKETLYRTNFKYLKIGSMINLEKSMKFGDRISGHFVQGHVDTVAVINLIKKKGRSYFIKFSLKKTFKSLLIYKGSIAINGISLTISKVLKNGFQTVVIPHTLKKTNLIDIKKGDFVNVEFDILLKYINKLSK